MEKYNFHDSLKSIPPHNFHSCLNSKHYQLHKRLLFIIVKNKALIKLFEVSVMLYRVLIAKFVETEVLLHISQNTRVWIMVKRYFLVKIKTKNFGQICCLSSYYYLRSLSKWWNTERGIVVSWDLLAWRSFCLRSFRSHGRWRRFCHFGTKYLSKHSGSRIFFKIVLLCHQEKFDWR